MISSSNIPLEQVPHLWSADVKALREVGIASAGDLVQSVHENGLKSLSDSVSIPLEPLHEYLTAAEAFVSEEKTRRRATVMFALALSVIIVLSGWMMTVQAGLLPRSAVAAENAYADLHEKYAGAATVDQQDLLNEVTTSLEKLGGEADSSRVNLLLLSSALNDRIAIDELQRVGDDPSDPNYASQYERYEATFNKARDEQARIEGFQKDDPRIVFARVNAAQAWASRAEKLGRINLSKLPLDDQKRIDIEDDLHSSELQAREETSLARNTPNFAPELFAQRIDNVRHKLDYQVPRRLPESTDSTEAINAINRNIGSIDTKLGGTEDRIVLMEKELGAMQTSIADLQSPLADLLEQVGGQETVIVARVDGAHIETRDLIDTVNTSLATVLKNIDENTVGKSDPTVTGSECGLLNLDKAKEAMKRQCSPRRGLRNKVTFAMGIIPSADGPPTIVVLDGPSVNPLDCVIQDVMADFTYDNKEHQCQWTFEPR